MYFWGFLTYHTPPRMQCSASCQEHLKTLRPEPQLPQSGHMLQNLGFSDDLNPVFIHYLAINLTKILIFKRMIPDRYQSQYSQKTQSNFTVCSLRASLYSFVCIWLHKTGCCTDQVSNIRVAISYMNLFLVLPPVLDFCGQSIQPRT